MTDNDLDSLIQQMDFSVTLPRTGGLEDSINLRDKEMGMDTSTREFSRGDSVTSTIDGSAISPLKRARMTRRKNQLSHGPDRDTGHNYYKHDDVAFITSITDTRDPYTALLDLEDECHVDLSKPKFVSSFGTGVGGTPPHER